MLASAAAAAEPGQFALSSWSSTRSWRESFQMQRLTGGNNIVHKTDLHDDLSNKITKIDGNSLCSASEVQLSRALLLLPLMLIKLKNAKVMQALLPSQRGIGFQ